VSISSRTALAWSPRWVILAAGLLAAVFLAIGLAVSWQLVQTAGWSSGGVSWLPAMAALGVGSYTLRFLRWHLLARRVAPRLWLRPSLRIYMAGFAMGLTPGRVGEFCKFALLRDETGVPEARSAFVFPLERVTEATSFAGLAVAGAGLGHLGLGRLGLGVLGAIAALPALALIGLALRRRRGGVAARGAWLRQMTHGIQSLVNPGTLLLALLCALAARCCDALLFWATASAVGVPLPLAGAALAFGLAGLAGGLLLLPAGVGAVEGSLVATAAALGGDPASALVAAVLARCLTLWVWVPLGLWFAFRAATRPALVQP
jgi:uncharacterized membrane protein YbhN (UPF0104 family)